MVLVTAGSGDNCDNYTCCRIVILKCFPGGDGDVASCGGGGDSVLRGDGDVLIFGGTSDRFISCRSSIVNCMIC